MDQPVLFLLILSFLFITHANASNCPPGAVQGLRTEDCYSLSSSMFSWSDAEDDCQLKGGHLASVHSGFENVFIHRIWDGLQLNYFWLGGSSSVSSSTDWSWSDGTTFDYENWARGEPHSPDAGKACLIVDPATGTWYARACEDPRYYVCAVPRAGNATTSPPAESKCCPAGWTISGVTRKCHKLVHNLRWNDALAACEAENGSLASIHSEEENSWIAGFAALNVDDWNRIWLGFSDLRQNGNWEFTDGSKVKYTNWGSGRPTTRPGANCAFLHTDVPQNESIWYMRWAEDQCNWRSPLVYSGICQLVV